MTADLASTAPEPSEAELERADRVARAYHLHVVQGCRPEDVAKMMQLARSTVYQYLREAKAQAALVPWMEREQVRIQHYHERQAMRAALHAHAEVVGASPMEYIPVLLEIQKRAAAEYGLDTVSGAPPVGQRPDPIIIEAIRNHVPDEEDRL